MLKIHNALTHQVEEFKPINSVCVTMYTCGPTVYDYPHIGNLRTFVFSDILLRVLKYNNFKVKSAQNITDVDDKIIKRAQETNKTIKDVAEEFTKYFLDDTRKLNIQKPDFQPRATEYVDKMAEYIQVLLDKGFAYKEDDESIYFDISKFADYGKLSSLVKRELKTGTRILSDEYTKDNVQDFALWKAIPEDELGSFKTNLGWGRPGWHIECSVMSQTLLGDMLDIHTGGVDLIFPHHENEIAQSEAKTGKAPFVKYWIHGAYMLVDGKKMSKSLNNFYTLSDLEKKEFDPLALRYLYLQIHYRQEMNFTWEALEAAQTALNKLRSFIIDWQGAGIVINKYEERFKEAINDDLNMPQALAVTWEMFKSEELDMNKAKTLAEFDKVLGLGLVSFKKEAKELPENIKKLLKERDVLRKEKKYEQADKIREEIIKLGFSVEDN